MVRSSIGSAGAVPALAGPAGVPAGTAGVPALAGTAGSIPADVGATGVLAAAFLIAAALAVLVGRHPVAGRLRTVHSGTSLTAVLRRRTVPVRLASVLAGGAAWAVIGGVPGIAVGLGAAILFDRALRRLEPRDRRLDRTAAEAVLPFAADLVAAALRAGATVDGALRCVAVAVGGPLGRRLDHVAAAYALGADPADVWRPLGDLPAAVPVVRAAIRNRQSGAAIADALQRAADSARATSDARAEAAARRAGVMVVLPVGLCFLPAFVLLGVVPVIVGVVADVLRW